MNKIIISCILLMQTLSAIDAKMEIVKQSSHTPSIIVSISNESKEKKIAQKIKNLIIKDLEISNHFKISNVAQDINFTNSPSYSILSNKVDLFLTINTKEIGVSNLAVDIKLYDINSKTNVLNKNYIASTSSNYPFLAHNISIDINKHLNAPSIEWMNRLIIFSKIVGKRISEIIVSDYTLTYQKVVVSGGLNIFPKWANDRQTSFYYTSYNEDLPVLKKQNIYTAQVDSILTGEGMVVASDVSNESPNIILTLAPEDQTDIYTYNTNTKSLTRVTNYKGIDVSGKFVEDDKKIVFVSDRLKYPNIFSKTIGQEGVERLVYHGKNNSQCTTSGNNIIYSSRESSSKYKYSTFNLYLISTKSDAIKQLTSNGKNKFPNFSKDGESLLFIKNSGPKSYLGIIRLNHNKSFLFQLKSGEFQSIDW